MVCLRCIMWLEWDSPTCDLQCIRCALAGGYAHLPMIHRTCIFRLEGLRSREGHNDIDHIGMAIFCCQMEGGFSFFIGLQ
uniref:Uncharacterized protein n=1 Tax=Salix viminalis TaxID=40686 RepID=A0A6N2KJX5_SALVM